MHGVAKWETLGVRVRIFPLPNAALHELKACYYMAMGCGAGHLTGRRKWSQLPGFRSLLCSRLLISVSAYKDTSVTLLKLNTHPPWTTYVSSLCYVLDENRWARTLPASNVFENQPESQTEPLGFDLIIRNSIFTFFGWASLHFDFLWTRVENLHAQFCISETIYSALYFTPAKADTPKSLVIQSGKRGHHLPLLPSSKAHPQPLSQFAIAITLGRSVGRRDLDMACIVYWHILSNPEATDVAASQTPHAVCTALVFSLEAFEKGPQGFNKPIGLSRLGLPAVQ